MLISRWRTARAQILPNTRWSTCSTVTAAAILPRSVDAILVNAGVTQPLPEWLDALGPGGRLLLPITSAMPAMGPHIGKGLCFLVTKHEQRYQAGYVSVVAIYSAVGIRDESLNEAIGLAMKRMDWSVVKPLRRDPHHRTDACWYHGNGFCFSRED